LTTKTSAKKERHRRFRKREEKEEAYHFKLFFSIDRGGKV